MATLTIRNLDDDVNRRLRHRAAANGRGLSEEVRAILRETLGENLAAAIRARVASFGGVDLKLPDREPMRTPRLISENDV